MLKRFKELGPGVLVAPAFIGPGTVTACLSSPITAPLAMSFAVSELLQIKGGEKSVAFKATSVSILLIGATLALTGIKPIKLILLAQSANGLLLPIVACFLLFALNRKRVLGEYVNGVVANVLGAMVVLLSAGLGLRLILKALGVL